MSEAVSLSAPPSASAAGRWGGRLDFPAWLPPMLVKELRQGLRARGFIGSFIVFHLIMVIVFGWTLEITVASGLRGSFNSLNGFYWTLLSVVLLLVGPLRALGSLRTEVEQRTLDLLVLTRLTAWRIVVGKWTSLLAQSALIVLTAMPYGVVRYFFGSVDLASDLLTMGSMFLGSAVLCAGGLWISTLPRIFRVLLPIGFVLAFQSFGISRMLMSAVGGRPAPLAGAMTGTWSQVLFAVGGLGLMLLLSTRRLAPPAENHSLLSRLFALGLLGLGLVMGSSSLRLAPEHALGFALMVIIMVIDISEDRLPMSVHIPAWARRRPGLRVASLALLPGWPSAALFAAVVLGGLGAAAAVGGKMLHIDGLRVAWVFMLAWQAIVAPAVIISFLPRQSSLRLGGGGYFVTQGLFAIISVIAISSGMTALTQSRALGETLEWLSHVLPISSFWIGTSIATRRAFTAGEIAGQIAALGTLVAFGWRQSWPYREALARIRQRDALARVPRESSADRAS